MTVKTTAEKRPRGRPEVAPEQRLVSGSIRLTLAQWVKFAALGDGEWLRKKIDRATNQELKAAAKRMLAKFEKTKGRNEQGKTI